MNFLIPSYFKIQRPTFVISSGGRISWEQIVSAICFLMVFVVVQLSSASNLIAANCEEGDPLAGYWQLIYYDSHIDRYNPPKHGGCELSGTGTLIGELDYSSWAIYTYELIEDDKKLTESYTPCGPVGMLGDWCGQSICLEHDSACTWYESNKMTSWVGQYEPCIADTSTIANTLCGSSGCNEPQMHKCGEAILNMATHKAYWFPAAHYVTSRSFYQWVCNNCTGANSYSYKITECGGAENVINWDNATCTGECKPCVAEYEAKVIECGGAEKIFNWSDITCTGECIDPDSNLGQCQN